MTDVPFDRRSGVFLHVTSLPGPGGVGTLGEPARAFVDWLADAGQSYWQVCPLGPTSGAHGNSPYQSFSAFAGNPLLVDLGDLAGEGWLDGDPARPQFDPHHAEYDRAREHAERHLRAAAGRFEAVATEADRAAFERFRDAGWLDDYALFMALKREFGGRAWTEWPAAVRERDPDALARYREELADEVRYREFVQFCFDRQWRRLREYATDRGVEVVGDLPIYVALDSVDVWANPEAFLLDADHRPRAVAGVPPGPHDDGQRWGNPLYDWTHLRETGFGWWLDRFERLFDLVDVARLDHFGGFERYWAIPADAADPSEGEWREAPGGALFERARNEVDDFAAIAEDIGHVSEAVQALRRRFGFPGMRVPQYADWCTEDHMYLPHAYPEDVVAYTGTHDTDTVVGWYRDLGDDQRDCLHYYLGTDGHGVEWDLLDVVWGSDAVLAVAPLQDVLGLGSDARFNTPGTAEGNWTWRVTREGLADDLARRLRDLTAHHGRLG